MKKEIIKSFSLEAWKNGAKIRTRNGHDVRIICTDVKGVCFPIIALVKIDNSTEVVMRYTSEGEIDAGDISDNDLVIVEEVEEPDFWTDKENKTADGYFIDSDSLIAYCPYAQYNRDYYKNFADRKQAISAKAMARISQIMANDIEHFGGIVTDKEWEDLTVEKYAICRLNNAISLMCSYLDYRFLAFHTEEQRDLFLEKYPDLVREFLMID